MRKVINAHPTPPGAYFRQLWQYRQLVVVLAKRDLKAQFAQTLMGWLWLILKPIATLLVFTLFFDQWLQLDTGTTSYPAFAFSGMIIWYLFSGLVQSAGTAAHQNSDLVQKLHFPKLILPLSKVAGMLFEFSLHLLLLFVLLLILGRQPALTWLLAPLFLVPALLFGLALALWLNALTIRYRDLQHIVPYLTNFAIWLTPVFYPGTIVPEAYRTWLYLLNPVASNIQGLRWSLLHSNLDLYTFIVGIGISLLLLLTGVFAFIRSERKMSDLL